MRVARTREGVDTTRAVYTRYRHLDPRFRPAAALYGPREMSMAVALFGAPAIRDVEPDLYGPFRNVLPRSARRARSGRGWEGCGSPGLFEWIVGDGIDGSGFEGIGSCGGDGGGCGGGGGGGGGE